MPRVTAPRSGSVRAAPGREAHLRPAGPGVELRNCRASRSSSAPARRSRPRPSSELSSTPPCSRPLPRRAGQPHMHRQRPTTPSASCSSGACSRKFGADRAPPARHVWTPHDLWSSGPTLCRMRGKAAASCSTARCVTSRLVSGVSRRLMRSSAVRGRPVARATRDMTGGHHDLASPVIAASYAPAPVAQRRVEPPCAPRRTRDARNADPSTKSSSTRAEVAFSLCLATLQRGKPRRHQASLGVRRAARGSEPNATRSALRDIRASCPLTSHAAASNCREPGEVGVRSRHARTPAPCGTHRMFDAYESRRPSCDRVRDAQNGTFT